MTTVHARDCAPCDAARAIAQSLSETWDPLDNWHEHAALDGKGGTLHDELVRVAANVLHRYPLPPAAPGGAP